MGMAQRVGSALSTALFGFTAMTLGVGALAPTNTWAVDLEGTYTGTAKCTRYTSDGRTTKSKRDLIVVINQGPEVAGVSDLNINVNLSDVGDMDGRAIADAKKPTRNGEITAVSCSNSPDSTTINAVIGAKAKKADKPTKTRLKGWANMTGDGFNESCKWKAKRTTITARVIPECPGPIDSMDSDSVDADSVDADSVDADSVDADSVDADSVDADSVDTDSTDSGADPMFGVCPGQEDICAGTDLSQPWCVFGDQTVCCLPGTVPIVVTQDPLFVECIGPGI